MMYVEDPSQTGLAIHRLVLLYVAPLAARRVQRHPEGNRCLQGGRCPERGCRFRHLCKLVS